MKSVYLETSIFSFYYDERQEPEIMARRNWTRAFWEISKGEFAMFTGAAALSELKRGDKPHKNAALALAQSIPAYENSEEIKSIVGVYVRNLLMPRDPLGDALHLALASYHKCDFLVTWNCAHLANANKFGHIKTINAQLGLISPALVTPLELMGTNPEEI